MSMPAVVEVNDAVVDVIRTVLAELSSGRMKRCEAYVGKAFIKGYVIADMIRIDIIPVED